MQFCSESRCENGSAGRRLCTFVRRRWTQTRRQSSRVQIHSERQENTGIRKLRKTVRFEQEAPNTSSSSATHVSQEYLASGEKQDRPEPVLVHNSGHVDDDMQLSALDVSYKMDGRESRYIKEVWDWCRDEDARDLRRSALNERVHDMSQRP